MEKKLFIIDGNSILYREYYALPNLMNKHGEFTGALFGFAKIMVEIITKFKPSHIAVAFDAGKVTFRNEMFSGYKATRKPMPDDLRSQVEPVKQLLKLMNIKTIEKVGIEGDDVIGSLANKFKDVEKVIITGDRDSFQLVNNKTCVYLNKKGLSDIKILDGSAIFEEFGLTPSQMIDVKALQGDTSDNIPGVKGVGEKTALGLIQKYGSLDGVYQNIDNITGATQKKLIEDKDNAYMSLQLARIKCDEELDVNFEDLEVKFPFSVEVREVFRYNDFKSLIKRDDLYDSLELPEVKRQASVSAEYEEVLELEDIKNFIHGAKEIAYYFAENEFHVSNGAEEVVIKYSPLIGISEWEIRDVLKPIVENNSTSIIVFNSKAERHSFDQVGAVLNCEVFDCMIAKHLVSGESITEISNLLDYPDQDLKYIASYMMSSKGEYLENLERMGMMKLYKDLEMPLSNVLYEMEKTGFKVDMDRLAQLDLKYDKEIKELTEEIYKVVGREFNINSPKQLAEIIYDELALSKSKKRSTASEVLEEISDRHPLIPLVIRYRKIAKFSSGFIKNMYSHVDKHGFVHTKLNQTLTTTGRLSSSEPNLQNIPIRGEESREIRSMFVASANDRVLIDVDYSQIELRILAHVVNDEALITAFNQGQDIHTQTAMEIFGLPMQLITQDMRRQAKVVNFGIIYGMSDYGLASDLKIPVYDARQYIAKFFDAHPRIREFMDNAVKIAQETGRATTILGRTRRMADITSSNYQVRTRAERATYNMPIQGTASDIIKLAMVKISESLKASKFDAKLIMQVHDELIVDCAECEKEQVFELVENCMKNAIKLSVILEVDGTISYRWSEGH